MRRNLVPLLALLAAGCGGGGTSSPSPFAGDYAARTAFRAIAPDSTVTTVYEGETTSLAVTEGGRFHAVVAYDVGDVAHADTLDGRVSRGGAISGVDVATTADGQASAVGDLHGGKGVAVRSGAGVEMTVDFAASDGGTLRFTVDTVP